MRADKSAATGGEMISGRTAGRTAEGYGEEPEAVDQPRMA